MTDFQVWKQRREELLREAEMSRQAKALRATHKRRDGQRSALVWEMKRYAGGLPKLLRGLRKAAGYERSRCSCAERKCCFHAEQKSA
jgi:hypothetical protein